MVITCILFVPYMYTNIHIYYNVYNICDSHKVECTEQGFNYYLYLNNHKGFRKGESLGKPKLKILVRKKN